MSSIFRDLPRLVFYLCLVIFGLSASYLYGVISFRSNLPPVPLIKEVYSSVQELVRPSDRNLEVSENVDGIAPIETPLPEAVAPGLVLVAGDQEKRDTTVRVIDRTGEIIHEWQPHWHRVWGADEGDFPHRPVEGMYLHGVTLLSDGSLVANFEHQSTFRMNACGEIVWKLDNLGHHSVFPASDGTIWVASEEVGDQIARRYPFHEDPLRSWSIEQISVDGEILRSVPVIEILLQNDLAGLLYLTSIDNTDITVSYDTLHLNDVEIFPDNMESTVFSPGDIMMSLRNINAVIVVDGETLKTKFLSVGNVVRQHDPDFLPGDGISVFDNYIHSRDFSDGPAYSRIVELDARTGAARSVLDGTGDADTSAPFFTDIMGMHQRLPNGNILVVSSAQGRVMEFTPDGQMAWRYDNRPSPDANLRIYAAEVLPETMDRAFFRKASEACTNG